MRILSLIVFCTGLLLVSCRIPYALTGKRVITVSIPPFEYFVKAVADSDFVVNVMLPPGADHHSWEPLPGQITALAGSEAFVIDGLLGFEHAWMNRFREVNPSMKIIDLSGNISLIAPDGDSMHEGHGHEGEGADPHYWLSPREALNIAASVRGFIIGLNPSDSLKYDSNYRRLVRKISEVDSLVTCILSDKTGTKFMIFHPALTYLARDYNLEQISFEDEGKDPSPSRMKELIDIARSNEIKIIFVQAEYDVKGATVLAHETGAELIRINPMNYEWEQAVIEVTEALGKK